MSLLFKPNSYPALVAYYSCENNTRIFLISSSPLQTFPLVSSTPAVLYFGYVPYRHARWVASQHGSLQATKITATFVISKTRYSNAHRAGLCWRKGLDTGCAEISVPQFLLFTLYYLRARVKKNEKCKIRTMHTINEVGIHRGQGHLGDLGLDGREMLKCFFE